MAGYVNVRLPLGDDHHAEVGQLVHDPADRELVAGDDLRREDDGVAFVELELVVADGDAAERRARLALPAGRDDQHFLRGQPHRFVEADRRREILQIAGRLGDPQDPVERAARRCTPAARSRSRPGRSSAAARRWRRRS